MIVKRLFWAAGAAIFNTHPRYTIISKLFRKKNEEASKPKQ